MQIEKSPFDFMAFAYRPQPTNPKRTDLSIKAHQNNKYKRRGRFFAFQHTLKGHSETRTIPKRKLLHKKYYRFVESAKIRKIPFLLSKDVAIRLFSGDCAYCGALTDLNQANGIDRVDNHRGYTPDNVVSCCSACNMFKARYGLDAWLRQCVRVTSHLERMGTLRHLGRWTAVELERNAETFNLKMEYVEAT